MLRQRYNKKTGRQEYCLVSLEGSRVLEWYGTKRPGKETVEASEKRVQHYKHKGKAHG